MKVEFLPLTAFPRGTMLSLLRDAYSMEAGYEKDWLDDWTQADAFFYDNPAIADRCAFVTAVNGKAVGMICWDPRELPDKVELGHNCIRAAYKGQGLGKAQLQEALRRIRESGARRITVTTDEDLIAAQKNYEACGFVFLGYRENPWNASYAGRLMDYEYRGTGYE